MKAKFRVTWVDRYQEPQCKPDPRYPDGVDLDISGGKSPNCSTDLPYPAKGIGHFEIKCLNCKQVVGVTTAGRPDDPRSIKIACLSQTV
jgi:phage FluMu protein Com